MRKSLINISEKIDKRRLDAVESIAEIVGSLKIPFFIIGASARDFLLSYGHNIATTRATLDIDIGVRVPDWVHYGKLRMSLIETGEQDRYRLVEDMVKNAVGQSGDFGYMLGLLEELKSGILEGR